METTLSIDKPVIKIKEIYDRVKIGEFLLTDVGKQFISLLNESDMGSLTFSDINEYNEQTFASCFQRQKLLALLFWRKIFGGSGYYEFLPGNIYHQTLYQLYLRDLSNKTERIDTLETSKRQRQS